MERYQIVSLQEIIQQKDGTGYHGEIAVFVSDNTKEFSLDNDIPVYVTAFSYVLILSGRATLSIDENVYTIDRNTLCLLSPLHLTYFSQLSDDFSCLFLCLQKDFIDKIGVFNLRQRIAKGINMHTHPITHITADATDILHDCIITIRKQILRTVHRYHLELIQNALIRFYLELDNIIDSDESVTASDVNPTKNGIRLQEFITLLMNNFKTEHHVSFYAREMHITPQYLTLIVKRHTGKTVNDLINELIYCEARNLLNSTDMPVQEISTTLNFADQASFSKFFKRQSGVSPQRFRYLSMPQKETARKPVQSPSR